MTSWRAWQLCKVGQPARDSSEHSLATRCALTSQLGGRASLLTPHPGHWSRAIVARRTSAAGAEYIPLRLARLQHRPAPERDRVYPRRPSPARLTGRRGSAPGWTSSTASGENGGPAALAPVLPVDGVVKQRRAPAGSAYLDPESSSEAALAHGRAINGDDRGRPSAPRCRRLGRTLAGERDHQGSRRRTPRGSPVPLRRVVRLVVVPARRYCCAVGPSSGPRSVVLSPR